MYRDEDRERMPETLRQAKQLGIKVVRVWAFGEGGPNDVKPMADFDRLAAPSFVSVRARAVERRCFRASRQSDRRSREEQDLRAIVFDELVARHRRRDAVLALGGNQRRCRR